MIADINDDWKRNLYEELIISQTGTQQEKDKAYYKIGQYYLNCAPISLYKYFRDKDLYLNNVRNNKLWYSSPCNFNDVYDCDIFFDDKKIFESLWYMASEGKLIRLGSAMGKMISTEINKSIMSGKTHLTEIKNTTGVTCFSEVKDSLLMWAHYADNHRGFCVEYNLLDINKKLKFTPIPVIYTDEIACFDSINIETLDDDSKKLITTSVSLKSPEWSYEREWRIIRDKGACGDKWDDNKKGALLDMIKPSSIILGCNAKPDFEQKVKEYCQNSRINLYKMEKDERQYKLNQKTIFEFDNQD